MSGGLTTYADKETISRLWAIKPVRAESLVRKTC